MFWLQMPEMSCKRPQKQLQMGSFLYDHLVSLLVLKEGELWISNIAHRTKKVK